MATPVFAAFRSFQQRWDVTVFTRIPETNLRVAVKLLRDATWIVSPASVEPQIRRACGMVLDLLRPTTFWDIGANIGFYSWFVRRHPAVRRVVMFESDLAKFALIDRTIRTNALSNCQAMNVALSDRSAEARFLLNHTSVCRTLTLDELIAGGVTPPDFIRLDVKGAEHRVLAGGATFFADHRPAMIVATDNDDLVQRLLANGHAAFRVDGEHVLFVPSGDSAVPPLGAAFPPYQQAT